MSGVTRLDPADLVATAAASCTLAELDAALAAAGVWLALDPPGPRTRTLGDSLGAGGGGPLAARYGPPRDQVIGMSFVAGQGTLVKTGGRVVKNVAGFDLAKLLIGGQGAFGTIEEVHLRLRARPEADATRAWAGPREALAAATHRLMTGGSMLAAFEVGNGPWVMGNRGSGIGNRESGIGNRDCILLARAQGTTAGVREELDAAAECLRGCAEVPVPADVWERWSADVGAWPVIARIGADPDTWAEAVAMAEGFGATAFSATVPRGTVRAQFAGSAVEALRRLRAAAAQRGWPMTLEQADEATMAEVGVWGALNAGTERLVEALRAAFKLESGRVKDLESSV